MVKRSGNTWILAPSELLAIKTALEYWKANVGGWKIPSRSEIDNVVYTLGSNGVPSMVAIVLVSGQQLIYRPNWGPFARWFSTDSQHSEWFMADWEVV